MKKALLISAALLLPAFASAQSYIDDLETMKAQIAILQKKSELNEALSKYAGTNALTLPQVISTITDGNGRQATIMYKNGRQRTVSVGDSVAQGAKVTSIDSLGVHVSTKSGAALLGFYNPTKDNVPDTNVLPRPPQVNIPAQSIPLPTVPAGSLQMPAAEG